MPIDRYVLDDFSGGIARRAPAEDFTDRQWSALKGLVFEDEWGIRSQWGLAQVGNGATQFEKLWHLRTDRGLYLIAMDVTGQLWYLNKPNSYELPAYLYGLVWAQVDMTGAVPDPAREALAKVPVRTDGQTLRTGLLMHSRAGTSEGIVVYENDDAPGTLSVKAYTDFYPSSSGDEPDGEKAPHAGCGTMWGDHLVLGDIDWNNDEDEPLSASNFTGYPNYIWVSEAGKYDTFDPLNVFNVGLPQGPIKALEAIDAGLLVFQNASEGWSGVTLLRGTATDFTPEPFRSGLAATSATVFWPYTGTVVWIDVTGQLWHTNGESVERLDVPALGWPRTVDQANDKLLAIGPYLIVRRQDFVGCFRVFTEDGAWTELNVGGDDFFYPVVSGDQFYFLDASGRVMMFNRREDVAGLAERGSMWRDGVETKLDLEVATPTLAGPDRHSNTWWHRVGIKARGFVGGELHQLDVHPAPYTSGATPHSYDYAADPKPVDDRFALVAGAHGPSRETCVYARLRGDVELESFQVWYHRGRGER